MMVMATAAISPGSTGKGLPSSGGTRRLARIPVRNPAPPLISSSSNRRRTARFHVHAGAADHKTSTSLPVADLPPSVAVLECPNKGAPGGRTLCYVVGISHIAATSCDQVADVIKAVRPEIVMVELCKDRYPLLVPELCQGNSTRVSGSATGDESTLYSSEAVGLSGRGAEAAPALSSLGLRCYPPGRPVSRSDMETDAAALGAALGTPVRPSTQPPRGGLVPSFAVQGPGPEGVRTVMPLGSLDFVADGSPGAVAPGVPPPPPSPSTPLDLPPVRETAWRAWGPAEVSATPPRPPKPSLGESLGKQYLLRPYAEAQASAGYKLGVGLGRAWQVALQEAAACGAAQVHLGDRVSGVSARRLCEGVWERSAPGLAGPAAAAAAALLAALSGGAGPLGPAPCAAVAAAALGASYLSYSGLQGPIKDLAALAALPPSEIESHLKKGLDSGVGGGERVDLKGEDALLAWPGAEESVLSERDEYMAATLHAAATGSRALSPAFVSVEGEEGGGGRTLRYMMPKGGAAGACEVGAGVGEYEPLAGVRAVVGVVGVTHVHGIVKAWPRAAQVDVGRLLE